MTTAHAHGESIIGLDVGTSRVKAVAFSLDTRVRVIAEADQHLHSPGGNRQIQDPDDVVLAVRTVLRDCVAQLDGTPVVAISVATAMHGLIGLDSTGSPLTPVVTWADSRAIEEASALRSSADGEELYRATGVPVHPMSPLVKLQWFATHEPELFAATRRWIDLKAWVLGWLTGDLVIDESSASGTGLVAMTTRRWHPMALAAAHITENELPRIVATSAVLALTGQVASAIGLPSGIPVVAGLGDGPAATIGCGAIAPGVAGLSIGTSGALRTVVTEPRLDDAGSLFCYAMTDETWVVGGAISNGGSVAQWAQRTFASDSNGDLDGAPAMVPPGSEGLVMVPYLVPERAPLWDPDIPGAYLGLRAHHTGSHFVRAAVEGVALQLCLLLDQLDGLVPISRVHATGGAFASGLWCDVIAAAINRPVILTGDVGGTALGAAAVGWVALGRAPDVVSAVQAMSDSSAAASPLPVDADAAVTYAALRTSMPQLLAGLRGLARRQG